MLNVYRENIYHVYKKCMKKFIMYLKNVNQSFEKKITILIKFYCISNLIYSKADINHIVLVGINVHQACLHTISDLRHWIDKSGCAKFENDFKLACLHLAVVKPPVHACTIYMHVSVTWCYKFDGWLLDSIEERLSD